MAEASVWVLHGTSGPRWKRPSAPVVDLAMPVAALLVRLWSARAAVAAVAVVASLVGFLMMFRVELGIPPDVVSRQSDVGVSSVFVLVDTARSQLVDTSAATGSDIPTLADRASLLANLMVNSPIKDQIARSLGIGPRQLIATRPLTPADYKRSIPAPSPAMIAPSDPQLLLVRVSVSRLVEGANPIITVEAQAPDEVRAAALANQAVEALRGYLSRVAATDGVPKARRLVVRQLEPARRGTARRGPARRNAALAAVGVLGAGCALVLGIGELRRRTGRGTGPALPDR